MAVTILAILQLLSATAFGLLFLALLAAESMTLDVVTGSAVAGRGGGDLRGWALTVLMGGACVAELAAGILLLRMRQLGWTITMLLAGLGLASSIFLWWTQGATLAVPVMVQVLTVFYLNQRQVRVAFGISRRSAGDTLAPGRG